MGLYKQCKCAETDKCGHPWWGQSRGRRMSLAKWAKKKVEGKAEAKKVFALFEAAVLGGTVHQGMRPEHYTLSDLVQEYLDTYFIPRGRSLESEQYRFKRIKARFGNVKPEDLTTLDVERWANELRKQGISSQHNIARLKAILNWGFDRELFSQLRVRWKALKLEGAGKARERRLHEGEEEKLKAAAHERIRPLIEAALDTGLRAGALLGLTFGMVEGNTLVVPRKLLNKNKNATHDLRIPLTGRLKAIIEFRKLGRRVAPGDFIFGADWGAQRKTFLRLWNQTRKAAGVPKIDGRYDLHWHDLRGEFATRLHEANVPIETISYLLDHATIEMTRRYIKVRTRSSKPAEAIAALEQFQAAFASKGDAQQSKNESSAIH